MGKVYLHDANTAPPGRTPVARPPTDLQVALRAEARLGDQVVDAEQLGQQARSVVSARNIVETVTP